MSQSAIIAAALIGGFFIYITVKGELPQYLALFLGNSSKGSVTTVSTSSTSGSGTVATNAAANAPAQGVSSVYTILHQMEAPAQNRNTLEI